jgi:hypothetical protein
MTAKNLILQSTNQVKSILLLWRSKNTVQFLGDTVILSKKNTIKGVSCKKAMEISLLSNLIDKECKAVGIHHIVDLGCGLVR